MVKKNHAANCQMSLYGENFNLQDRSRFSHDRNFLILLRAFECLQLSRKKATASFKGSLQRENFNIQDCTVDLAMRNIFFNISTRV